MKPKKILTAIVFSVVSLSASAQFGVSYHESSMPLLGFGYELEDRYFAELRVGTNNYFENLSFELTANYIFINEDDFDFYGGVGGRTTDFSGLVIPAGVNVYPFENKRFGVHMEAAGLFGETAVFRASWGIRYRFGTGRDADDSPGE